MPAHTRAAARSRPTAPGGRASTAPAGPVARVGPAVRATPATRAATRSPVSRTRSRSTRARSGRSTASRCSPHGPARGGAAARCTASRRRTPSGGRRRGALDANAGDPLGRAPLDSSGPRVRHAGRRSSRKARMSTPEPPARPPVSPLDAAAVEAALAEALAAVVAAGDLDELKAARLAHAGDRSPLALANREIGRLAPADKAVAGKLLGTTRGRLAAAIAERQTALEAERDDARAGRGGRRRHPARGPHAARRPAPARAAPGAGRRHLRRDGLGDRRGPRGRGRVVQLRRPELRAGPPRAADAGHLLRRARRRRPRAAHPHLAGAGPHPARPASCPSTSPARARRSGPTSSTRPTPRSSTRSRGSPSTGA